MTKAAGPRRPAIRVDVIELGTLSRRHWIGCEIEKNLDFNPNRLESYCLGPWEPVVFDAFLVAAAVQFCDHAKKRPATGWGRDITLRLPVHDPERWNARPVSESLHDALAFLTGDHWKVSFGARRSKVEPPRQGHFHMPDQPRVIIPFSDGLDSRLVAGLMECPGDSRLVRVQLGSKRSERPKPKTQPPQFASMPDRPPFASVPFTVRPVNARFNETSARSRGFKFALLSGLAAYLSQADTIIMPESGQGALGTTLVPVGQAYEDYRNHPVFTAKMEKFLLALFGHRVQFTFPRIWHTKGETLAEYIATCGDHSDWQDTRSCWQSQRQVSVNGQRRQCGICAACMLRRLSVHAGGATENQETYVWEDLTAVRFEEGAAAAFGNKQPRGALYEYAIAGTLHLDHLANLRDSPSGTVTLDRTAFQLSRVLREDPSEIKDKLNRLLQRHEDEWRDFVHSLGSRSFVTAWATWAQRHVN